MGDSMFILKMPDVNAHSNALEPGIFLSLFPHKTICIIKYMLGLLCAWHRECILDHDEEVGDGFGIEHCCLDKNNPTWVYEGLLIVGLLASEMGLECSIS